ICVLAWPCRAQSGFITTFAGTPSEGTQATTQGINRPGSVCGDGSGGFYFTGDFVSSRLGNFIYHVGADGILVVAAGIGRQGNSGDGGPATFAELFGPGGVAVDSAGNLFIADF